jgi:O-antigen ligase
MAHRSSSTKPKNNILIIITALSVGLLGGALAIFNSLYLAVVFIAGLLAPLLLLQFESTLLGLLILRSSLDLLSPYGVPGLYALGLIVVSCFYIVINILTNKIIKVDSFLLFFLGWTILQLTWVISLNFGILGLGNSHFSIAVREWLRILSMVAVYFLVLQLKGKIHPNKLISILFISLAGPLIVGFLQVFLPTSVLPAILLRAPGGSGGADLGAEKLSRIFGTLGHANDFAKFLCLFIGLTLWRFNVEAKKFLWIIFLGLMTFLLISTNSLFSLAMFAIILIFFIFQKLSLKTALAGILIGLVFFGIFVNSPFGKTRLESLENTMLFNPNIDVETSILLHTSFIESNSFNWRIMQWYYLVENWKYYPILGHGLSSDSSLPERYNRAHNDYVRALVEGGILGLSSYLLLLITQFLVLIKYFIRAIPGSPQQLYCFSLISILIASCAAMLTDNVWGSTAFMMTWWMFFNIASWEWEGG